MNVTGQVLSTSHAGHAPSHGVAGSAGWVALLLPIIVAAGYLILTHHQARSRKSWPPGRTAYFLVGAVIIAVVLAPPFMHRTHVDLRWHMVQHLAIGMVAPLALVLGAPFTLLLRTLPVSAGKTIVRQLRRRPVHWLTHPAFALLLNIGGMYLLYLTPLFAWSMDHPVLHWLVLLHVLLVGTLFTWSIAGPDPAPRRPGMPTRVVALILSAGLHAYLAKAMYAHLFPREIDVPADQIRQAAMIMYYGGDIAELLLAVALFGGWYQARRRYDQRRLQPA